MVGGEKEKGGKSSRTGQGRQQLRLRLQNRTLNVVVYDFVQVANASFFKLLTKLSIGFLFDRSRMEV